MKIDICKLLGVEEGEEFVIETKDGRYNDLKYKIENNIIKVATIKYSVYSQSSFGLNDFKLIEEIIKLPKKKKFSDDELCILRNIDKKYKWIARDKVCKDEYDDYGNLNIYLGKPNKDAVSWLPYDNYGDFNGYNHLFQSIKWEDEEPIYIDDYVKRGGIDE